MDLYQFLMIALLCFFLFILIAGVLWFLLMRRNTVAKNRLMRAEAINRLVDKFGSAKEVAEFLKSEQGRKILEDPAPPPVSPRIRVIRLVQIGVVTIFLGIACFVNAWRMGSLTDPNFVHQYFQLQYWGTICLAIGAGLLLVGFITTVLVNRWGLNGGKKPAE